ncbi:MAG: hypothetical protein II939_01135 [Bacteroidales bacterium]|nr:hypothetical protein [Bacteroidales bacterium]
MRQSQVKILINQFVARHMNLNKPTKIAVLDKISSFKKQVVSSNHSDDEGFKSLITFMDNLNEILNKNDKSFIPMYFKQIRFKHFKLHSILDSLFIKALIPFCVLLFFVKECASNRASDGFKGGYYSDMIFFISLSVVVVLGLFLLIKYFILDKKQIKFNLDDYLCHIDYMINYMNSITDEQFEQISFELAVKEL